MCVHVNIHPPIQRPVSLPLCTCPYSRLPAQVSCQSRQSLAQKRPKSDQTKCHAPFLAGAGRAGAGRAGAGRAGVGRAGVGRAGVGRAGVGRAGAGRAGVGRAGDG